MKLESSSDGGRTLRSGRSRSCLDRTPDGVSGGKGRCGTETGKGCVSGASLRNVRLTYGRSTCGIAAGGGERFVEQEASYQLKADAAIRDLLLEFECQPILFIGSGISRRYFGAPNWPELLKTMFGKLPAGADAYEYNRQKYDDDMVEVGTVLSELAFEWAWKDARDQFPPEYFSSKVNKDVFLKHLVCEHIASGTPKLSEITDDHLAKEIDAFADIKPHAIITTNYDMFLEQVFDGYEPISGQTILRYNTNSFGEIFHIHGDVTNPKSIVLTKADYEEWTEKKKYVSAKLLTYFAEHPVFILGYGLGDPNVKSILRDIGELVADEDGLIPNVYQVVWRADQIEKHPPDQAVFAVDGKEFRIRAIHTNDFNWVFEALKSQSALKSINPKLVRALAARTMKLVRHDIPSGAVEVNYETLEKVADEKDFLPTLLGITVVDNPNQSHPLTITQLAARLDLPHWAPLNKLIHRIKAEKGVDLRSTDNRYHCRIKTGTKASSMARKWSHEAVNLFKKVMAGEDYEVVA
ncbi:SIR2 family protein [Rhizobium beringeri]|uniref:SIR2 family NAD-dependent protein deacylase n=1 Tax=Rhizobium beringeri TaxID=3019934 RepID=UPI003CEC5A16